MTLKEFLSVLNIQVKYRASVFRGYMGILGALKGHLASVVCGNARSWVYFINVKW